jgi:hypothetical protein
MCTCLFRVGSMLQSILIASGSARILGAPVHSATLLTVHRSDRHGAPERVRAPQLWLDSIGPVFRWCVT